MAGSVAAAELGPQGLVVAVAGVGEIARIDADIGEQEGIEARQALHRVAAAIALDQCGDEALETADQTRHRPVLVGDFTKFVGSHLPAPVFEGLLFVVRQPN